MNPKYQPGDLVSPLGTNRKMMVAGHDWNGKVICEWQSGGVEERDTFDEAELTEWSEGGKLLGISVAVDRIFAIPLGGNRWRRQPGRLVYSEGFLDRIEGIDIPHTMGEMGISVTLTYFSPDAGRLFVETFVDGLFQGEVEMPMTHVFVD